MENQSSGIENFDTNKLILTQGFDFEIKTFPSLDILILWYDINFMLIMILAFQC